MFQKNLQKNLQLKDKENGIYVNNNLAKEMIRELIKFRN